ncbi:MAG: hypothetical protein M3R00_05820 [Pseudomonadota bacterium]|nr:hypothetical protein [Pseudomonadota bacterium]
MIFKYIAIGALCLISGGSFGKSEIITKNITVTESNIEYTITSDVTLKGDYQRFVRRMMDTENYVAMEVPYIVETHKVSEEPNKRILWLKIASFPMKAEYYLQFDYDVTPKRTDVDFRLIPKSGTFPEKHDYEILKGHMVVKVVSGKPQNATYNIKSVTVLKFKREVLDIPEVTIAKLKFQAEGGLRAFAN